MVEGLPDVTRVYQNHHLDSKRWDQFRPRDDDIIVSTPYKCGTTWMQMIIINLIYRDAEEVPTLDQVSPWVDARFTGPIEMVMGLLEGIEERRCIKSHLGLDGLPYHRRVKYLCVGRDARDVFMSLWNHWGNYTDQLYETMGTGQVGDPMPRRSDDLRAVWRDWIGKGWFDWESEGFPYWGNMHHIQSFWDYRHLPNLLMVHYNDLTADPEGQIKRVADYLDMDVTAGEVRRIAEATHFDNVKQNAAKLLPGMNLAFAGGADAFIYKGTNGRWREALTEEDITLYEEAKARVLSPGCAQWLEKGWLALDDS
ncbi:MAG: sulfotransferase domain-containing protein [Pseudomonadales bacterium]